MGLFRDIARAATDAAVDAAKVKATEVISAKMEAMSKSREPLVLAGTYERRVYTYYGKPLKGLRVGDSFMADVVTTPVRLASSLTGGEWDTGEGGIALAYRGKVFGATSTLAQTFGKIARKGYRIKVKCMMTGWFAPGYPETVMLLPDPDKIFAWLDECDRLGEDVPFGEWE